MNHLSIEDRAKILRLLVEGNSLRSISRIQDISINTATKVLERVGNACLEFHHHTVVNLPAKHVQCDEIWAFVGMKQKTADRLCIADEGIGDAWTFVAIGADTKLVISWLVGCRDAVSANDFMAETASRLRKQGAIDYRLL